MPAHSSTKKFDSLGLRRRIVRLRRTKESSSPVRRAADAWPAKRSITTSPVILDPLGVSGLEGDCLESRASNILNKELLFPVPMNCHWQCPHDRHVPPDIRHWLPEGYCTKHMEYALH